MTNSTARIEGTPARRNAALKAIDFVSYGPGGFVRMIRDVWGWVTFRKFLNAEAATHKTPAESFRATLSLARDLRGAMILRGVGVLLALPVVWIAGRFIFGLAGPLWWPLTVALAAGFGWYGTRPKRAAAAEAAAVAEVSEEAHLRDVLVRCVSGMAKTVDADKASLRVGPYVRDYDAQAVRSVINLPTGITLADVRKADQAIADGLKVWPDQLTIRQIKPGRIELWKADVRPSEREVPAWPLHSADRFTMATEALPIGITFDNDEAALKLSTLVRGKQIAGGSMLVGGASGSGKTTFLRLVISAAALDPNATIALFDGKGDEDYDALAPACDWYRVGADSDDLAALKAMLEQACALADARRKGRAAKHPLLIVLDEIQRVRDKATLDLIEDLVRVSRSAGVYVIVVTQKPSAGSVPTDLRDNVLTRVCFRVPNQITNDMILGTGAYSSGLDATKFEGYGSAIVIEDGKPGVWVKAADVTEDQAARIARRHPRDPGQVFPVGEGDAAQGPMAGTTENGWAVITDLPQRSAVQDPEPVEATFLDHVRQAWDEYLPDQDRAASAQLAALLPLVSPIYDGWAAADVTKALKAAGVEPKVIRIGGKTPMGVLRAQIDTFASTGETASTVQQG